MDILLAVFIGAFIGYLYSLNSRLNLNYTSLPITNQSYAHKMVTEII